MDNVRSCNTLNQPTLIKMLTDMSNNTQEPYKKHPTQSSSSKNNILDM